jgi:Family of unknown function (DUF5317)
VIVLVAFALLAALGVFVGHGSLRAIGQIRLRGEVLLLLVFGLQAVARGRLFVPLAVRLQWNPVVPWAIATAALLAVLLLNWRVPGIVLAASGTALNLSVVAANGGMPVPGAAVGAAVSSGAALSANGFYHFGAARLPFLGDVVLIPSLGATGPALLLSPGDVLLVAGVCLTVMIACLPPHPPTTSGAVGAGER